MGVGGGRQDYAHFTSHLEVCNVLLSNVDCTFQVINQVLYAVVELSATPTRIGVQVVTGVVAVQGQGVLEAAGLRAQATSVQRLVLQIYKRIEYGDVMQRGLS